MSRLRMVKGSAVYLLAQIVMQAGGFVFTAVAVRALGTVSFGAFALGQTIMTIAARVGLLGLPYAVQRYLSGPLTAETRATFGAIVTIGTTMALLTAAALGLAAPFCARTLFRMPELDAVLRVFAVAVIVWIPMQITHGLLRARGRAGTFLGVECLYAALKLVGLLGAMALMRTAASAAASYVAASAGALILTLFVLHRAGIVPRFAGVWTRMPSLLRYSSLLLATGLGYYAISDLDKLMLGRMLPAEVGSYAIAAAVASPMGAMQGAVVSFFMPVAATETQDLRGGLGSLYRFANVMVLVVDLMLFAALLTVGGPLMQAVFGTGPREHAIACVLAGRRVALAFTGPSGALFNMTGRHRVEFVDTTVFLVVNVVLNVLFIARWGALGAAGASLASTVLLCAVQAVQVRVLYDFSIVTRRHLALTGIMAACGVLLVGHADSLVWRLTLLATVLLALPVTVLSMAGDADRARLRAGLTRFSRSSRTGVTRLDLNASVAPHNAKE